MKKTKYKDINLLTASTRKIKTVKESKSKKGMTIFVGVCIAIALIIFGYFFGMKFYYQMKIDDMNAVLKSDENIKKYEEISIMNSKLNQTDGLIASIESYRNDANNLKNVSLSHLQAIYAVLPTGGIIRSLNYTQTEKALQLNVEVNAALGVKEYIGNLIDLNIFKTVEYLGYTRQENTFIFTVDCVYGGDQ